MRISRHHREDDWVSPHYQDGRKAATPSKFGTFADYDSRALVQGMERQECVGNYIVAFNPRDQHWYAVRAPWVSPPSLTRVGAIDHSIAHMTSHARPQPKRRRA